MSEVPASAPMTEPPAEASRPPIVPLDRDSLSWQLMGDVRSILLFMPAAFALQGLHPVIAAGVWDHSTVFTDPGARAWRSFDAVLRWIYGGDQAFDEARVLREIHKDIQGVDFDGNPYHALAAEPFAWVWATGWLAGVNGLRTFWDAPVTRALEEQAYEEFKNVGRILGVRERCIPPTLDEFEAYFDRMLDELARGHQEIAGAVDLLTHLPKPQHVPAALWSPINHVASQALLFLLATGSPPQLRTLLATHADYHWTPRRQRASAALVKIMRLGNMVPSPVRRLPEHALVRIARRQRFLTTSPRPTSPIPHARSARSAPPQQRCPV